MPKSRYTPSALFSAHRSFISPEDIKLGTDYALTLNPVYQANDKKDRFKIFKKNFSTWLKNQLDDINYYFYVEKSDVGRLHVHGVINFETWEETDKFYDFLHRTKRANKMTFKFGDITDDELFPNKLQIKYKTWDDYIKKQQDYWMRLDKDSYFSDCITTKKTQSKTIMDYFQDTPDELIDESI